jgi:transposase
MEVALFYLKPFLMLTRQQLYEMYYAGPDVMLHYVENVLSHLEEVERHVGHRQQYSIDALAKRVKELVARVERLKMRVAKQGMLNYQLQRRVQELQTELARREREGGEVLPAGVSRDSHNSGLPPSLDLPGVKAKNAVKRTRSLRRKSGKAVGGQVGHRGATLRQVEFPDRVQVHEPRTCRRCRASLAASSVVGRQRRQVFDLPPVVLEVTEHWAETKRCSQCGERTKARFPLDVKAPVQYGQRVRAVATYLHKYQLLPFARTSEAMRDLFTCRISPGTVHTTRHRCAAKLVGVEEQIKNAIKESEVIGADETGLRVAGKSHWIHVARTDDLTHYGYDARRGRTAMDTIGILPHFRGICVRDGWFTYDDYSQATHALCNVHLLRELVYVEEVCAEQQQWTRPFTKLLYDIKAAVEKAKVQGETKLDDEQLTAFTNRYDRLIKRAARLNPPPKNVKPDPLAKRFKVVKVKRRDPASPLIYRLQTKREQVLRFMTDFRVPFDNNGSERDIRMVKLQQKIGGCFRTEEGATAFCRIRSYLSTARKQGHSTLTALECAFAGQPLTLKG